MDYNQAIYSIIKHITNDACKYVAHANLLLLVKDHLPDGTPCWRKPTQEEINEFNKEKTKDEI